MPYSNKAGKRACDTPDDECLQRHQQVIEWF